MRLALALLCLGPWSAAEGQRSDADSVQALVRAARVAYAQRTADGYVRAITASDAAASLSGAAGRVFDQARALDLGCLARREAGRREDAAEACRRSLALYAQVDSTSQQGTILIRLGDLHQAAGRPDSALASFRGALAVHRRSGNVTGEGTALVRIGVWLYRAGRADSALLHFSEVAVSRRAARDTISEALAEEWLGVLEAERSRMPEALAHYRTSLALFTARGPEASARRLHRILGRRFLAMEQGDSAVRHLARSLAPDSAVTDVADEVRARRELGNQLLARPAPDSALAIFRRARTLAMLGPDRALEGAAYRDVARGFAQLGRFDSAAVALRASLGMARAAGDSVGVAASARLLGSAETARRLYVPAVAAYREALAWWPAARGDRSREAVHEEMAVLFEKMGEADSARAHRAVALAGTGGSPSPDSVIAANRREIARHLAVNDAAGARAATTKLATTFAKLGPPDSADAWQRRALALHREARDSTAMANALSVLGETAAKRRATDTARTLLREAALIRQRLGREVDALALLNRVSHLLNQDGQLDSAIATKQAVIAAWYRLGNPAEAVGESVILGAYLLNQSRYDSLLALTAGALAALPPGTLPSTIAMLYGLRGHAFSSSGHYDSSLVNARRALGAWEKADNAIMRALAYGELGDIYRNLGQFDSALTYHRREHAGGEQLRSPILQASAWGYLARDHDAAGVLDSAIAAYRMQQQVAARTDDWLGEIRSLSMIADLLERRGNAPGAAAMWREALARARASPRVRETTAGLALLGDLFDAAGEADSALVTYRTVRAQAAANGDRDMEVSALNGIGYLETQRGNPEVGLAARREVLARERASGSLERVAMSQFLIGRTLRRMPKPDLAAAAAAFDTAAAYRAIVRLDAGRDENKVSVGARDKIRKGEWELTWLARAPTVGNEAAALGALAAAERGRAQALLDLMRGTTVVRAAGDSLVAEGRRLVGAGTAGGAAVLSYLVSDDTLITWYARPGAPLLARTIAVRSDSLAALVARWRRALKADGAVAAGKRGIETDDATPGAPTGIAAALGAALAAFLLPPELALDAVGVRELVIVPHGSLSLVPFAALPAGRAGGVLASRVAIRYAPSLASLAQVEQARALTPAGRKAALAQALIVGNPVMPPARDAAGRSLTLGALPASALEATSVATRLGASPLTGAQATESAIRRRMPEAPLIHLATHGYAYATAGQARNSFVALAPDATGDGLLTVGEVLDGPTLRADLVVLSACQTGLGNLAEAEGTVGLQRAFLARGARSLLVSLWSVSDEATALLMQRFYAHWLSDADAPTKSEALRRAQADVRKAPGFAEPRYWAAFQLVGGR